MSESTVVATGTPTSTVPACARCGHDAELDFGTLWLCRECYHLAGSTCAGVGTIATPADPSC